MIDSLEDPISLLVRKSTKQVKAMMADNDVDGGDSEGDAADELDEMTRSELKRYIKENELDIKIKKTMSDDDIRDAINDILLDNAEVEEEEPEEEEDDLNYDYEEDASDESEEEDDEDDESVDFEDMSRSELKAYIKDNDLDIRVKKTMDDEDIIEAIKEAEEDDEPEDESDDDEFFED
jgi:hypothetical protein